MIPANDDRPAMSATPPLLGFYGKLPARGDFLSRRLPAGFIASWDEWLQDAIAASRVQLGDDWLPRYLEAPLWRFFLPGGICGGSAAAGVMMASVDRVGRYFPLVLALPLAEAASCDRVLAQEEWFVRIEELALATLSEDFDLDRFDAALAAEPAPDLGEMEPDILDFGAACVTPLGPEGAQSAAARLFARMAAKGGAPLSVWWSSGSAAIAPMVFATPGLPPAGGFAALLDGEWERWGWKRR